MAVSFQKADLAIADLTITYEREQAVDFTMPFMNLGKANIFRISQTNSSSSSKAIKSLRFFLTTPAIHEFGKKLCTKQRA